MWMNEMNENQINTLLLTEGQSVLRYRLDLYENTYLVK